MNWECFPLAIALPGRSLFPTAAVGGGLGSSRMSCVPVASFAVASFFTKSSVAAPSPARVGISA